MVYLKTELLCIYKKMKFYEPTWRSFQDILLSVKAKYIKVSLEENKQENTPLSTHFKKMKKK